RVCTQRGSINSGGLCVCARARQSIFTGPAIRTMPPLIIIGTRNRKKREEILEILGDLGLEFADLSRWPDAPEVIENSTTFEANARKKAAELSETLSHWVLGEDSGLVVPALNGRPGVYSARYAGKQG